MPYFDDDNMSQYSQVNVMAAYVSMIRFAMDKLELHLDELGDDILFDGMPSFPDDVLGDDSLFGGYTNPWSAEDEYNDECACDCKECREYIAHCNIENYGNRMSVGNIMDILSKTRKAPKDYRMD